MNGPRFRELRRVLLGLVTAFSIVTLVGVAVFYIIPTFFVNSGPGWSVEQNDRAEVYYLDEELPELDPERFLERVSRDQKKIVEKLHLKNPPDRIRIYIHKDLSSLRTAINRRKSSSETTTPLATVDLIYGTPVEPLLVRVLTKISWGVPSSEFLILGLQQILTDQVNHPHVRTAALKGDVFTLQEISTLENVGKFPRTLQEKIYDYFDSPRAPAGMNLSQLSSLMGSRGGKKPYRHELEVESASFVSYLIDNYGVNDLHSVWKSSSLREGVGKITEGTLVGLGEDWLDFAEDRAENNPHFHYYRSRTLYEKGRLKTALTELEDADNSNLNDKRYLELNGKINFYRGEWSEASNTFSRLNQLDIANRFKKKVRSYLDLIKFYRGGKYRGRKKVSVFGLDSITNFKGLSKSISQPVGRAIDLIPDWIEKDNKIVVYIERGQLTANPWTTNPWKQVEPPEWVIRGSDPDILSRKIAELVVLRAFKTRTYSNLLRFGMINFLVTGEVFQSASKILEDDNWRPLDSIVINVDGSYAQKTEAAAFVGFLLHEYGRKKFSRIWFLTTPRGGDNSLESALDQVVGSWLDQVEANLKDFLRSENPQFRKKDNIQDTK